MSLSFKETNMLITKFEVDKARYKLPESNAKIYACLVEVNASDSISSVIREINDNSWISKLDIVDQVSYTARLQETVKKIMKDCLKFDNDLSQHVYDYSVVGEYIVSKEGRNALHSHFSHLYVPLAELWKEKVSGNPGFDYHSETESKIIIFGEAKYKSSENPYTTAIQQVERFINEKKDLKELTDLRHFISNESVENCIGGKKGFSVAFSIKSDKPENILDNAIRSEDNVTINDYDEFYIIGVIINDQ